MTTNPAGSPRLRRLRRTPAIRALVRETRLHPSMLVAPLFVRPGTGDPRADRLDARRRCGSRRTRPSSRPAGWPGWGSAA